MEIQHYPKLSISVKNLVLLIQGWHILTGKEKTHLINILYYSNLPEENEGPYF